MTEEERLRLLYISKNKECRELKRLLKEILPIAKSGKSCVEFDTVQGRIFYSCKDCGAEGWGSVAKHKPGCNLGDLIKKVENKL